MSSSTTAQRVQVVAYDERWIPTFEAERDQLKDVLGSAAVAIHHVGSTSVPGMYAKPVIDILVEATELKRIDLASEALEERGFEPKGEYGIPGRRYFSRPARATQMEVHVHAFACGDSQIERHLRFRDYLRSHPADASKYGDLKRGLAAAHAEDRDSYQAGKAEFIQELDCKAEKWHGAGADSAPGHGL